MPPKSATIAGLQVFNPNAQRPNAKGPTKLQRVITKTRDDKRDADKFKAAVWLRDKGQCRVCQRKVIRSLAVNPKRGEVHHLQTRGTHPEKRYDVSNGVLLCAVYHQKAQRHEITIPKLVGTP